MEPTATLSALRICVALCFFFLASVMDWRTRKVSDAVWIAMGTVGIALLAYDMLFIGWLPGTNTNAYGPVHFLIFIPISLLFFDAFREWGIEVGGVEILTPILVSAAITFILLLIWLEGLTLATITLVTVPLIILFIIGLYYARLIYGGADAKALMALAILFPIYPVIDGLPFISPPEGMAVLLQTAYPFTFLILMNAAILHVIAYPVFMLAKNLWARDVSFPEMLLGYRMEVKEIPGKFVWPMEVVRDGKVKLLLFPRRGHDVEAELEKVSALGLDRIWVTPKAPFIISLTAGLIFSIVVGNLLHLFL